MAKVTFTDELNIKPQRQTFPKLSGLKKGDKVRIQLMSVEDIDMEFVHNLEEPIIENGAGVLDDKGNFKKQYRGSPLSFGDISILEERGLDPKNCPISAMAAKNPEWVQAPRRKFAMHIIQYRTKPGSFELSAPFNVEHKVWVMTEKTFAKLQEFTKEWGDLRKHDLTITCENEQFQQFDISVSGKAAWMTNQETANLAKATYEAGKEAYPDLSQAIGQRKERDWVVKDLKQIEEAWKVVSGKGAAPAAGAFDGFPGNEELDSLLNTKDAAPAKDILAEIADGEDDGGGVTDFDALLNGM